MLRKVGVLLASLAMVLVSSLALVLVPATQAAATMPMPGGGDGMFNGGRTYGNAPAGVGQGGHTDNYKLPDGQRIQAYLCYTNLRKAGGSCPAYYYINVTDYNCPALADGTLATSFGFLQDMLHLDANKYPKLLGFWCNYPPQPKVSDVYCALSVGVSAVGPKGNPTVSSRKIINTTVMSDWSKTAQSRKDPVLCGGSVANYNGFDFPAFGKYQLDVVKARQWCKRTDWLGDQPSLIDRCTTISRDTESHYAQQWCGGILQDGLDHGHNFTAQECLNPPNPVDNVFECNKPSVTLDGLGGNHAVLDDGKGHTAEWAKTKLSGSAVKNGFTPVDTTVTVDENVSTPFRENERQESTKQKFQGVPSADTRAPGDQRTMVDLRWFAPSLPTKPWILARSVTVWSHLTIRSATIGVNMTPAGVVLDPTDKDIFIDTNVACDSQPLHVRVNRARNFR